MNKQFFFAASFLVLAACSDPDPSGPGPSEHGSAADAVTDSAPSAPFGAAPEELELTEISAAEHCRTVDAKPCASLLAGYREGIGVYRVSRLRSADERSSGRAGTTPRILVDAELVENLGPNRLASSEIFTMSGGYYWHSTGAALVRRYAPAERPLKVGQRLVIVLGPTDRSGARSTLGPATTFVEGPQGFVNAQVFNGEPLAAREIARRFLADWDRCDRARLQSGPRIPDNMTPRGAFGSEGHEGLLVP